LSGEHLVLCLLKWIHFAICKLLDVFQYLCRVVADEGGIRRELRRRSAYCDGGLDKEVELVLLHGLHSSTLGMLLPVMEPWNYFDVGDGCKVLTALSRSMSTAIRLIIMVTAPVKASFRGNPWGPSVDRGNAWSLTLADARQSILRCRTRNRDVHLMMRYISGFARSRKQCIMPAIAGHPVMESEFI
jgi:hypothetical protein